MSDASISAAGDVPPKFTQLLKDIEGTEGELVRFECRVIGQPTPTIKWFRGRNQIDNSPDFQVDRPPYFRHQFDQILDSVVVKPFSQHRPATVSIIRNFHLGVGLQQIHLLPEF